MGAQWLSGRSKEHSVAHIPVLEFSVPSPQVSMETRESKVCVCVVVCMRMYEKQRTREGVCR